MKTSKLWCFILFSLLLVCATINPNNAFSQISNDTELYPVRVNGKEGYIDATGRIVIKPQFDEVGKCFSEALARVKSGDKWGYIDKNGKIVITPQFYSADDFHEGMARVGIGDWEHVKSGYIDKSGKIVINPQFDYAYGFSEGLAKVQIGDWRNGKYGFIDKTGKIVINPQYDLCSDFSEGLASVTIGSRKDGWRNAKDFFIDKNGNNYYNFQFGSTKNFSEGLAYVSYGGKQGYINKSGSFVFYLQTDYMYFDGYFKEGLATIEYYEVEDGKLDNVRYGFIDKTGRMVINLQFDDAEGFSEGLACVRIGGKHGTGRYGFIDKTGTYLINPQYDYAESFKGGIAAVVINNQFQYIDKRGNIIWTSPESPEYIESGIWSKKADDMQRK